MKKVLLHTPEGVRDIYNKECEQKMYLQEKIHGVLKKYGYQDVQTPSFEFFDIFSKEKGSVASNQMYKFFDREGNTLVLRPDLTPPMARCVSKYYMEEDMPIRLCYQGQTFINTAEHQGKLKEYTHAGAELYGEDNADCDSEVVVMVIEALLDCGLKEFQIEVGHAGFFNGLLSQANLQEEEEEELRSYVENKNFFGMEEYLSGLNIAPEVREGFFQLSELNGQGEVLAQAKELASNSEIKSAISRLEKLNTLISYYGYEKYVSYDLSVVAQKNYYTGIIFAGYTYGTGDAIVTGGRYDRLVKQFGKDTASIGFAINVDRLLMGMQRQKLDIMEIHQPVAILYENQMQSDAIAMAGRLRGEGKRVVLLRRKEEKTLEAYQAYGKRNEFARIYYLEQTGVPVKEMQL